MSIAVRIFRESHKNCCLGTLSIVLSICACLMLIHRWEVPPLIMDDPRILYIREGLEIRLLGAGTLRRAPHTVTGELGAQFFYRVLRTLHVRAAIWLPPHCSFMEGSQKLCRKTGPQFLRWWYVGPLEVFQTHCWVSGRTADPSTISIGSLWTIDPTAIPDISLSPPDQQTTDPTVTPKPKDDIFILVWTPLFGSGSKYAI